MDKIFFDNWESIFRTAIISILAYVSLILLLRISGKRTLSKMNAFDSIVTIALGSTLATVLLNKDVALADGVLAFAILILLQFIITFLSVRVSWINNLVKSTPSLLVYKGDLLENAMRKERITKDEILAFIREKGFNTLQDAGAVILETDGSLTLVTPVEDKEANSLQNVKKPGDLT